MNCLSHCNWSRNVWLGLIINYFKIDEEDHERKFSKLSGKIPTWKTDKDYYILKVKNRWMPVNKNKLESGSNCKIDLVLKHYDYNGDVGFYATIDKINFIK